MSLVDTVKVVLDFPHPPLIDLISSNLRRDGNRFWVQGRFARTRANIHSRNGREVLAIEGSVAKFLTGQNVVGIEDVLKGAAELILEVLHRAGLPVSDEKRQAILSGDFRLTRVDFAGHCKCETNALATAAMCALRRIAVTRSKHVSLYGHETVVLGSTKSKYLVRIYRKDTELKKRSLGKDVFAAQKLLDWARHAIRVEVTLKGAELKRRHLDDPRSWNAEFARKLVIRWIKRLCSDEARIPDIREAKGLPAPLQAKLHAWLLGDEAAFLRHPNSCPRNRRLVLKATGIDVSRPFPPSDQARHVKTLRSVLLPGLALGGVDRHWPKLRAGKLPSVTLKSDRSIVHGIVAVIPNAK